MISRAAFIPVALTLFAATLLTALLSFFALYSEFHYAKWIVDSHPPLPRPTGLLYAGYPVIWMLPSYVLAIASYLCRRTEISAVRVSWFVSSVLLALFVWFALNAVAFFCIYAQRSHYIGDR